MEQKRRRSKGSTHIHLVTCVLLAHLPQCTPRWCRVCVSQTAVDNKKKIRLREVEERGGAALSVQGAADDKATLPPHTRFNGRHSARLQRVPGVKGVDAKFKHPSLHRLHQEHTQRRRYSSLHNWLLSSFLLSSSRIFHSCLHVAPFSRKHLAKKGSMKTKDDRYAE